MSSKVTVIIPTFNKKDLLEECLNSLQKQALSQFDTVVVDNGSSDGTSQLIEEKFPEVRIIRNEKNRGFVAVNQAIVEAKTEYIALLNNDAIAVENWLEELVRGMERFPEAGFAAAKILQFSNKKLIESAGDGFSQGLLAGYSIGNNQPDNEDFNYEKFVFSATGNGSIYRKELFDKVGLFDKRFFAYFEDIDLGFRANLAGFKCVFLPKAVIFHRGGQTAVHNSLFHLRLTDRNKIITVLKNMPLKYIFRNRKASFDLFFWPFEEIFKLRLRFFYFAYNRLQILFWLPFILSDRFKIAKSRKITDEQLEKILV
ncbi:MAG TPA: glycosyltransferase family 2 protein [Candidatus Saccharimonadales bacterium]|nr:glycosyltransferase family 2 protein [Candidatus Saccharimonadales bacterium]